MRVTTRKIRSLLRDSQDSFGSTDSEWVQAELRELAGVLGVARDAEVLGERYQRQLDLLSREGQAHLGFVDYDPPTFVVVGKQMVLQMTLKNVTRFDPEKTNIYKRAAQTFDLFVAPKMKDVLDRIPSDVPVDYYDFSVVNPLSPFLAGKERSEAIEFLLPKKLAQSFANNEVTNQELIDKGQVLVNGVRIALNLQLVE